MFRGVLVLEVALFVEALRGARNHHFGPIHRVHVEEYEDLAQVVLGAGGADAADGGAHHGYRLALPRVVAVGSRRPVDGVLQHARKGIVVFGRGQQNGIGGADAPLQLHHPRRQGSLVILVEQRNAREIENIQAGALGHQALGGSQRRAVIRALAKTAGDSRNGDRGVHATSQ